tara:strand:+ start:56 stop:178 length:123 start_codon:yes stop_codon:yes gene_type:complete
LLLAELLEERGRSITTAVVVVELVDYFLEHIVLLQERHIL